MESILLFLLLGGLLILVMSGEWRTSLYYTVFVGFTQDPLRKLTPNQPGILVGLVLISAVATVASLYLQRGRLQLRLMVGGDKNLTDLFPIFFILVLLQCLNSFGRYGSLSLTGIGLGFYAAPILALWLGFQFSQRPDAVPRLMRFYVAFACIFAFTTLLSFWGVSSPLFKEVGSGVFIHFNELGMAIQGHVGLWRSSEIAAWHLGAAACFTLILGVTTRRVEWIVIAGVLATLLLGTSVLTGRRKVISLVIGFAILYALLIIWRTGRTSRDTFITGLGITGVLIAMFVLAGGESSLEANSFGAFLRRSGTVWGDLGDRINFLGFRTIQVAFEKGGLAGLGVGAASESGISSLGLKVSGLYSGGAGEGGFAKIILELGIVGFAVLLLLGASMVRLYYKIITGRLTRYPDYALLNIGLLAFIAANIPVFMVASQVYGDPFVLLIIGLSGGFVLGANAVVTQGEKQHFAAHQNQEQLSGSALP